MNEIILKRLVNEARISWHAFKLLLPRDFKRPWRWWVDFLAYCLRRRNVNSKEMSLIALLVWNFNKPTLNWILKMSSSKFRENESRNIYAIGWKRINNKRAGNSLYSRKSRKISRNLQRLGKVGKNWPWKTLPNFEKLFGQDWKSTEIFKISDKLALKTSSQNEMNIYNLLKRRLKNLRNQISMGKLALDPKYEAQSVR